MRTRTFQVAGVSLMLAIGMLASGCKDQGVGPDISTHNVQFSVQAAGSVIHKVHHETLHITSVKILLKRIALSRATSDDSTDVHTGSIVVDLNLDAKMTPVTATRVRAGVYDRVRFDIHKPEDHESIPDSSFRVGSSGNERYSVVVTGLYHDTPFTFTSRESARQELVLLPPVAVTEEGTVNVTMKIDPYAWFTVNGLVLDPFNQDKQIDERVKGSFASVFKDNDRNGEPD
ncbi:MAG: hypothetical protein IPI01_11920 [Ignavibacteriae bacterium]|nr:hypothetical protein [Ignavibacteriota bacterium]